MDNEIIQIGSSSLGSSPPDPQEVRDESEDFFFLEASVGTLGTPSAVSNINWHEVVQACTRILRDKSKDLLAACYLCRGLLEQQRYTGLADGLTVLRDIIQIHWESAYPPLKRAKMRGSEIGWLAGKVGKILPQPNEGEAVAVTACLSLVIEIQTLLAERLAEYAPSLGDLREPLETYRQALPVQVGFTPNTTTKAAALPEETVPPPPSTAQELIESTDTAKASAALDEILETTEQQADERVKRPDYAFLKGKLEYLVDVGHAPLTGKLPNPQEFRGESEEFASLEHVGRIGGVTKVAIEWHEVVETCATILREKSKDLLAAVYLCRALFERESFAGLATGLIILSDLIQEHWDTAYPPLGKAKRRGNEIGWLVEKLGKVLPEPKPQDEAAILVCAEKVAEIEAQLDEKLGSDTPSFRELRDFLNEHKHLFAQKETETQKALQQTKAEVKPKAVVEKPKPAEPSLDQSSDNTPTRSVAPPVAPPTIQATGSATEVNKALKEYKKALYNIALFKRGANRTDPAAYYIMRFAAWADIVKAPIAQNGKFVFPGPPKSILKDCENLLAEKQYPELLDKVEDLFANPGAPANCYWLDAHRFSAAALAGLGMDYQAARQVVIDELAAFVRRMPGILDLVFNDDTPFADAQTKLWVQDELLAASQVEGNRSAPGGAGDSDRAACLSTVKEARQLAGKGNFEQGLALLQAGRNAAHSRRAQFIWGLEQARFCHEMNHTEIALPQLEFLDNLVEHYALEEWEPQLSVEVAQLLLMCHNKLSPKGQIPEEIHKHLYARLCRLDISAALALRKKS